MSAQLSVLFLHQQCAIAEADRCAARLIFRLPGTGKTRIGIELIKRQLNRNNLSYILWICPANLIAQLKINFHEFGIANHDLFPDRIIHAGCCLISSYDMIRQNQKFVCEKKWDLIICDEIHKAKTNQTKTNHSLWHLRRKTSRWYGFTGTPFQNTPYEFFELVSLCLGHLVTFECELCLQYKFPQYTPVRNFLRRIGFHIHRTNQGPIVGISSPERLRSILRPAVDYIAPEQYLQECHLPKVSQSTVQVPLTKTEEIKYKAGLTQFSRKKRYKFFASDDMVDEQLESYFKGLSMLRTIALQESKPQSTIRILRQIQQEKKKAKILVFCNFVENGLKILSKQLAENKIAHILYNGEVPALRRAEYIDSYLCGKTNIILLSPVGFEGLDLYGTTHIIILDPHYNPERSKQLMSRAIRAFSNVETLQIIKLHSVSQNINVPLIDDIIEQIAERKAKLSELLENVLK